MNSPHETRSRIDSLLDNTLLPARRKRVIVRSSFADQVAGEYARNPNPQTPLARRAAMFTVVSVGSVSTVVAAILLLSQQVPTRTLGSPNAEFSQPFSEVRGVRELSDGTILINDYREMVLKHLDLRTGTIRQVGRNGNGPGEYGLPMLLIPLGKDTTGVLDIFGEMKVVLPGAVMGSSMSTQPTTPGGATITTRSRGDGRGYLYSETRTGMTDSLAIERFDPRRDQREIVGYVNPRSLSALSAPPGGRGIGNSGARGTPSGGPGGPAPPFASMDQWTVANDGRIAMVSARQYTVTFTETDGRRWTAAPIPFSRIRVSDEHKAEWRKARERPVASVSYAPGSSPVTSFSRRSTAEPAIWPEFLPPFLPNALSFAPDGKLWIERTKQPGTPAIFDVINARGQLEFKVVLPPRTKLAGFGATSVYLVRVDDDDVEFLQRYALPSADR